MTRVTVELSDEELAVIAKWQRHYLSLDMPHTISGTINDMLRRIADDMREMEEWPAAAAWWAAG